MKSYEFVEERIEEFLRSVGRTGMAPGYLRYAAMFSIADAAKPHLETHHVLPRCCGGSNDPANLVAITKDHHTKLHKMILASELSDRERKNLQYAYLKRIGKKF